VQFGPAERQLDGLVVVSPSVIAGPPGVDRDIQLPLHTFGLGESARLLVQRERFPPRHADLLMLTECDMGVPEVVEDGGGFVGVTDAAIQGEGPLIVS
jgi:hypothetical protein